MHDMTSSISRALVPVVALGLAAIAAPPALAAGYSVLFAFGSSANGDVPVAGLIRDKLGNLYGTTTLGGASGVGTVFELDSHQSESVLYSFQGGIAGYLPYGGVIADKPGNLYGTASDGGNGGIVFKLAPGGSETALHTFDGGGDGIGPMAGLVMDKAGNLYGTTEYGGAMNGGTVFKVTPGGNETVLHSFGSGIDGSYPIFGSLLLDKKGNIYGTTSVGGAPGAGIVFKLSSKGKEAVLYEFENGEDGATPYGGLIADKSGDLIGTTTAGGASGDGIVFKLTQAGKETVLYSFKGGNDGAAPSGALIADKAGNLYGTTDSGGVSGMGTVFVLAPNGGEQVLHAFAGGSDGANPGSALIADSKGNLYGTTQHGGSTGCGGTGCGTVFAITE
jgi:uncharacterized repeat protein (TIGR03803 family)